MKRFLRISTTYINPSFITHSRNNMNKKNKIKKLLRFTYISDNIYGLLFMFIHKYTLLSLIYKFQNKYNDYSK